MSLLSQQMDDFPIALIVDTSKSALDYLDVLEQRSGLRWVLTHNFEAYCLLLHKLMDHVGLVALDFEYGLTDKLRYYLELVRSDKNQEIPAIFMPSEKTIERANRIRERDIDRVLKRPFDQHELESLMGELLGRSERKEMQLKFWIFLESRTIEGVTNNLSGSGMGGTIPDPILFSHVHVRLFTPNEKEYLDLYGLVRRKQRETKGGYTLGIQFERIIEGDPDRFRQSTGVDFGELKDAGEQTRTDLAAAKLSIKEPQSKPD